MDMSGGYRGPLEELIFDVGISISLYSRRNREELWGVLVSGWTTGHLPGRVLVERKSTMFSFEAFQ